MFELGDKVFPIKKSFGVELEYSRIFLRMKEMKRRFLYVIRIDRIQGKTIFVLNNDKSNVTGDFFLKEDLKSFVQKFIEVEE